MLFFHEHMLIFFDDLFLPIHALEDQRVLLEFFCEFIGMALPK